MSAHDKERSHCELRSPENWAVANLSLDADADWGAALVKAFDGYRSLSQNLKVLIAGTFTYEGSRITKVEPESVELVGERELRWRIPFLISKNQSNPDAVKNLRSFQADWFKFIEPHVNEHPSLYLLDPETISAEWDTPTGEVSLTSESGELCLLYVKTDGSEEELETRDWERAGQKLGEWLS